MREAEEEKKESKRGPSDESYHSYIEYCSRALNASLCLLLQESSGTGMISPVFRAKNKIEKLQSQDLRSGQRFNPHVMLLFDAENSKNEGKLHQQLIISQIQGKTKQNTILRDWSRTSSSVVGK